MRREKERERNTNEWLPLVRPQLGTWPTTQARTPDWESNRRPFGSQASAQFTEPHQSGLMSPCFIEITTWLLGVDFLRGPKKGMKFMMMGRQGKQRHLQVKLLDSEEPRQAHAEALWEDSKSNWCPWQFQPGLQGQWVLSHSHLYLVSSLNKFIWALHSSLHTVFFFPPHMAATEMGLGYKGKQNHTGHSTSCQVLRAGINQIITVLSLL